MDHQQTSSRKQFTINMSISLTPQEEDIGSVLTFAQKKVMQKHKANIAQDLLNLEVDVTNIQKFAQNQAYLKGQLAMIDTLFDLSEASEARLAENNSAQSE